MPYRPKKNKGLAVIDQLLWLKGPIFWLQKCQVLSFPRKYEQFVQLHSGSVLVLTLNILRETKTVFPTSQAQESV